MGRPNVPWWRRRSVLPEEVPLDAPPIGRPITNTQVYVLDDQLKPVPEGNPGELHMRETGWGGVI